MYMYRIYLISNQTAANNQAVNISILIVHINRIAYFSLVLVVIVIIIRMYWVVSFDRN